MNDKRQGYLILLPGRKGKEDIHNDDKSMYIMIIYCSVYYNLDFFFITKMDSV